MMRDDRQLAAVCKAVCRRIPKDVELWTERGPTDLAVQWAKSNPLSTGENALLHVAWALWNGSSTSKAKFGDVLDGLHDEGLSVVGSLFVAVSEGAGAVDRWIEAQEVRHG